MSQQSAPEVKLGMPDLRPILERHTGNERFKEILESISNPGSMFALLANYIQFNSVFGGGVANLAGEIAVRQNLFQDPNEPLAMIRDRSSEIAALVFHAAIDEFGDTAISKPGSRFTHRALAQATLKGAQEFFGFLPSTLNTPIMVPSKLEQILLEVKNGYLLNQTVNDESLFQAIGFHMGSEILADGEFRILDKYLFKHQQDLVEHLRRKRVTIDGREFPAYYWIRVHTKVEADHFDNARMSGQEAIRFYNGALTRETVKGHILTGFERFAGMQTRFMEHLATGDFM